MKMFFLCGVFFWIKEFTTLKMYLWEAAWRRDGNSFNKSESGMVTEELMTQFRKMRKWISDIIMAT